MTFSVCRFKLNRRVWSGFVLYVRESYVTGFVGKVYICWSSLSSQNVYFTRFGFVRTFGYRNIFCAGLGLT